MNPSSEEGMMRYERNERNWITKAEAGPPSLILDHLTEHGASTRTDLSKLILDPKPMIPSRNTATANARIISRVVQRSNRIRSPATTSQLVFGAGYTLSSRTERKHVGPTFGVRGFATPSGAYIELSEKPDD